MRTKHTYIVVMDILGKWYSDNVSFPTFNAALKHLIKTYAGNKGKYPHAVYCSDGRLLSYRDSVMAVI